MNEDFLPKMADHIEMKSVEELIPYSKNARTHSESQIAQIANREMPPKIQTINF